MRIACVATSQIPSSTANSIQVMKVCQSIVQLGNQVALWVPGKIHHPWNELSSYYGIKDAFEVHWLASNPKLKRYDFSFAALNAIRSWKADVCYTWLPQVGVLALLQGIPSVLEVHDRPTGKFGPWLLKQFVNHKTPKRLAIITRALEHVLQKEFQLSGRQEEVVITPNGVDLERFEQLPAPPIARKQLGLPDKTTAVYSGHFYAGRGIDVLFELAKAIPQVQFVWVGGNPDSVAEWQGIIRAAGIQNVILTGFIENTQLPIYQAAAEFLLMPYGKSIAGSSGGNSADICSPMKMFEYLATGRIILTSDLPVLHEVLNEDNAVFCPPEDPSIWIKEMKSLLEDPLRMADLSQRARQDAVQFTWRSRTETVFKTFRLIK